MADKNLRGLTGRERLLALLETATDAPANQEAQRATQDLQERGITSQGGKVFTTPEFRQLAANNAAAQDARSVVQDMADFSLERRMAEAAPTKTNLFPVMTPEEKQQTEQARRETRAQWAGNEAERLSLPGVGSTSPTAWMTTDPADTQRYWQLTRENQALNRQAEDMTTRLNKSEIGSWKQEQGKQYEGIRDNEDYAALSQPDESKTIKGLTLARTTGNLSIYNYINNLDGYADRMKKGPDRGEPLRKYDFLTARERADYNYVTKNQGLAAGKRYLEFLEYDLNARMTQAVEQEARARASASPVGASALSVAQNLAAGAGIVSGVAQGVQKVFTGKPVDYNTAAFLPSRMSTATREQVAADIEKKHPNATVAGVNVLSFLYQTGMSMADSGVIAALTAVGIPGAVSLLGGSAATSAALDVKERGGSDLQALSYGLAAGFAEGLFEEVSLEKLIHPKTADGLRGVLMNIVRQAFTEGSEEFSTTLANTLTDRIINGDKSELLMKQRQLMMDNPGMSEEDARWQAWMDWTVSLTADFIGGAISGGIMGGGASSINFMTETNLRKAGQAMRQMGVTNTDVQDAILTAMNGAQAKQDRVWLSNMADRAARGEDLAGTLPLADLGRVFMLRSELGPNQISEQAYQRAAQNAARPHLNEEATPAQNAATEAAGEAQGNTATAPTQEMAQRGAEEATEAAPATRQTAPLRYALNKIRNGEDVSGNDVRAIMDDEQAMQTLWDSGMLPDTIRPGAEGRQQVQQAVQRMAEQGINDRSGLRIGAAEALTQEAADEYTEEARPLALPTRDDQARDLRAELAETLQTLNSATQEQAVATLDSMYDRSELVDELRGAGLLNEEDAQKRSQSAMLRAVYNYVRGETVNVQEQAGRQDQAADGGQQAAGQGTRSGGQGRSRTGGGSQRKNRVGTGGQSFSQRVEQIRGSWERQEGAGRIRSAVEALRSGERVSTATLGISNGTDRAAATLLPDRMDSKTEKELASFREAQRSFAQRGVTVNGFIGTLEMEDADGSVFHARGAVSADGKTIWVRMDHPALSWQQILAHEDFHERVKNDKQLLRDVAAAFDRDFTEEERKAIINDYFDTYGYYNVSEEYVMEEVLADYFAGIDVYAGTENAQKDIEARGRTVREAVGVRGEARSEAASGEARASREDALVTNRDEVLDYSGMTDQEAGAQANEVVFSRETNPETLDFLNNQETVTVYRAMQVVDGKLYPPMAAKVKGDSGKAKWVEPTELNTWYRSDERPDLLDANGKFKLDKGNGGTPLNVAYNPYFHTSNLMLNDQFSSAWDRDNLVVVEASIPKSELTSGYRAEGAKDPVGEMNWHTGPVASKLKGDKARRVTLSRWVKINRIVPNAEVAQSIANLLDGENISIPENTVTPSLKAELEKLGVQISPAKGNAAKGRVSVKASREADTAYLAAVERGDMETAQRMVDEAAKEAGYPVHVYHGTRGFGFTVFDTGKSNDGISLFATSSRQTAETYSGKTERGRIQDRSLLNADDLHGEELIAEARKYNKRYSDYRLMSEKDKKQIQGEARSSINWSIEQAKGFVRDNKGAFNADKAAIMDRLISALYNLRDAETEDQIEAEWEKWEEALFDLKWMDDSITSEFLEAVDSKGVFQSKNELHDMTYQGDMYADWYFGGPDYIFDNQLQIELNAELNKGIYDLYGKPGKQLVINANGENWNQITPPEELMLYGPQTTREIASAAKASGYDSVLFKDLRDNGGETPYNGLSDVYIFFDANALKSADPVTYDNKGKVIPLSERFNPKEPDIRYSLEAENNDMDSLLKRRSDLEEQLDVPFAELSREERTRLERQRVKVNGEIDRLAAEERRASRKTSMQTILDNLSKYRRSDLESLAEQISDGAWDGYEELNREDLESELRQAILDRDLNPLEMQAAKYGLYVRPVSNGETRWSRDIPGETEELRQENEALKERLAYWQSQVKPSDRTQPREEDVRRVARSVLKDYESGADREAVTALLRELAHTVMSEDVRWTDVRDQATRLAGTIIEAARTLAGGDEAKLHREIRAAIRSGKISFSGQADIPDYNQWRRENFGKLTIAKDGVPVETRWQELQDAYGKGYFPDDITNPTDQVLYLAELWDRLRDVYENPYSADLAEATQYLANELIDRVMGDEIRQAPTTYADRAQRSIRRRDIRIQIIKNLLQEERQRRRDQVAYLKERYQTKEAKGRESRKARELRTKITKRARKMTEELLRPTDKRHVPERLRRGVAAMLSAIDLGSGYSIVYDRNGNYSRVERGLELGAEETRRTQAFLAVRDALLKEADGLVMDPELLGTVEEPGSLTRLVTDLADTPIANMNSEELQVVYDALRGVEAAVRSANRMLSQARWGAVSEAADALRSDNAGKAAPMELAGYPGRVQGLTRLDMLTPEGYFHRLGKAGQAVFKMLRGAQDAFITNMADATAATREIIGNMDTAALEKEKHTVTMGGEEVTMTTAQIMELYCLMQRDQGMQHITTGGILIEPVRQGARQTTQTEPLHPSLGELADAVKLLTAEQIRVADALQQYLSVDMAELGNEATMAVYGYKKFGQEEKYWKIRSNRNELQQSIEKETQTTSVANRGFTKAVNPKADTSVKIGSIFDTYSQSINDMATYAAWLAVGEDVNRIRNYVWRNEEGQRSGTVKGILDRVIGSGGASYLQRLLADIANGAGMDDAGLTSGFVGAYKAAAIGANIRVIIQQPTAILRATEMIDPKYFVNLRNPMKAFERAKKYSPIAQWKDWGYFDINTGRKMKDVLFENSSKLEKVRQVSMALAGKADSFAWGQLWAAVEAETKDKTDLTPGTEAFYRACAERFNDIIDHTQVVDGILQRSQIMRSKDGITRMAVSFMGEPTKQYNQFMSAVYDVRHSTDPAEKKAAKQQMARTVFSMLAAGIANVLAQSIIDALRDDDREKKYWEKLIQKFLGYNPEDDTFGKKFKTFAFSNMGELINPASYLPYVKDIMSIIQGYNVDRMDMESIADTITAVNRTIKAMSGEGKQTVGYSVTKLAEQAAKLLGLPLYNLDRDLTSLFTTIVNDAKMPVLQYMLNRYRYKPLESGNLSAAVKGILWDARQQDDGSYDAIVGWMLKDGYDQEIIDKAMLGMMEDESGYTAAVKAADAAGNANKSYDLREKLTALQSLTIPEDERDQIMADKLSEKQYENFHAMMDVGMSFDEAARVYMKYAELDAEDLTTSEKAKSFALWLDKQTYTDEQKSLMKDRLTYWQSMPLEAGRYETFTGAGLSPDEAYDLDRELGALEPLPGKKSVSDAQRYDVILASNLSETQKLAAIGTVMGTDMKTESGNPSQWAKVNAAVDAGLKLDAVMGMVREDTLDYFTKYRDAGLGANDSMNLAKAIKALTPEEGKSQVSDLQKWQAAIRTISGQLNQDKALRVLMDDSAEAKYDAAYSAGINPDVYVKYKADTKDFSSDYDANGKEIKGQTKKDKFMSYIDGLNLTNPQKDALYFASGYSESTLEKDTPWHNGGGGGGVYARARTPALRLPTVEDYEDEPVRGLRLPTA